MVQQLGARGRVQVLQLLHGDLRLHVHDAQDERRVLHLRDDTEEEEEAQMMFYTQRVQSCRLLREEDTHTVRK